MVTLRDREALRVVVHEGDTDGVTDFVAVLVTDTLREMEMLGLVLGEVDGETDGTGEGANATDRISLQPTVMLELDVASPVQNSESRTVTAVGLDTGMRYKMVLMRRLTVLNARTIV